MTGTVKEVGAVRDGGMGGEEWGWVVFERAEEAEEAVQRFDEVVLAGQPMACKLSLLQEWN